MNKINDNGTHRDMTAEEQAAYDAFAKEAAKELAAQRAALQALADAKSSARTKLKALGLTDDEIAALVG